MNTEPAVPEPRRRSPGKIFVHILRRGHLYLGLSLFPWAILYGVTGLLFNHPNWFSEQPTYTFGKDALKGTPMAEPPPLATVAKQVVDILMAIRDSAHNYRLVQPETIGYNREFAFATCKSGDETISILFDPSGGGGTVRVQPKPKEKKPVVRETFGLIAEPFPERGENKAIPRAVQAVGLLVFKDSLSERIKASIPAVLNPLGFEPTDIVVTSVPDLNFFMADGDVQTWSVLYNSQKGSLSGTPAGSDEKPAISFRQFLIRLHVAHGYPYTANAKWYWAVVSDAMAWVLLFWGLSGLVMWWQIKKTRIWGFAVFAISAAAATALGLAMHAAL